ncbi:NADPH-dependent F420 reductase [Candidatus Bathyarchaeota archaeon]|nr:NADPH-dependent F420 reductase [Candidatus Bathyarchaeota archaeon]MBS7612677.1 NADPH-dependent F420 reductase [Candidatus Bathyarchaeota archaeon]MBS7617851.1 NADPH-dependent F420 reductase [Candidatus Bathyarchaeota archaeon]
MGENIAIIGGTAGVGYSIAVRLAKIGKSIVIGSRFQWKAEEAAKTIKNTLKEAYVEGAVNHDAVSKAEIVILTVPFKAQVEIAEGIRDFLKPNSILIDVTIPVKRSEDGFFSLIRLKEGSATERLRKIIPENVSLVASFKNISQHVIDSLDYAPKPSILLCGDSMEAKKKVVNLINEMGGEPVDCGPLSNAVLLEALGVLMINIESVSRRNIYVRFEKISD